ncbi:MAG: hypothetical protein LBS87_01610 [Puniceicoccales bacterium]|nr:hypothetical protein [Puniceicoccales bacterium]
MLSKLPNANKYFYGNVLETGDRKRDHAARLRSIMGSSAVLTHRARMRKLFKQSYKLWPTAPLECVGRLTAALRTR